MKLCGKRTNNNVQFSWWNWRWAQWLWNFCVPFLTYTSIPVVNFKTYFPFCFHHRRTVLSVYMFHLIFIPFFQHQNSLRITFLFQDFLLVRKFHPILLIFISPWKLWCAKFGVEIFQNPNAELRTFPQRANKHIRQNVFHLMAYRHSVRIWDTRTDRLIRDALRKFLFLVFCRTLICEKLQNRHRLSKSPISKPKNWRNI